VPENRAGRPLSLDLDQEGLGAGCIAALPDFLRNRYQIGGISDIFEKNLENRDDVLAGTRIANSSPDIHVRRRLGEFVKAGNGYVCFERVEQHLG